MTFKLLNLSVASGTLLFSCAAFAGEFGTVRSMQNGPVGDSPQFVDMDNIQGEANIEFKRAWGKYTVNEDPDSKISGSTIKSVVSAGGGFAPNKNFAVTGYATVTLASDSDEEQTRQAPKSRLDSGLYKHELALFGLFRTNSLVFGGGLGVMIFGGETREYSYDQDEYELDISSAAMPVARLFGGLSTKTIDLTGGARLFSMGEAVVSSVDSNKDKNEFDIVRRNPAEIHVDGRLKFGQGQVGASLAYVLTGQASEQIDEYSLRYEQVGNSNQRQLGGDRRNVDHLRFGVAGKFMPVKMVAIKGGLEYIQASYKKEQYASLEHENIGGIKLNLGGDVFVQKFNGFMNLGYLMDNGASYTVADNSRSAANTDRTQRAPLNQGDRVKVTQGSWNITAGGGISL